MTRTRASTTAPATGAAPVSGALLTDLAATSGLIVTGAAVAGAGEIRPDATSASPSSGGAQPSAAHDNPTTAHETGHPYLITTLPREQKPKSAKRKTAGDVPGADTSISTCQLPFRPLRAARRFRALNP